MSPVPRRLLRVAFVLALRVPPADLLLRISLRSGAAYRFSAEDDVALADIQTKVAALLAAHPLYPTTKKEDVLAQYDRVTVVDHPMVQHKFEAAQQGYFLEGFPCPCARTCFVRGYEATRDLALEDVEVETPICKTACKQVSGKKMVIVPILRAGLAWWKACRNLCLLWVIWMYRDPETHEPHEHAGAKMPDSMPQRDVLVVDPKATGGSATAAIHYLREQGVKNIGLLLPSVQTVLASDPDVQIYTCAN